MQNRAGGASAKSLFSPDLKVLFTHLDTRGILTINLAGSDVPDVHLCRSATSAFTLDFQLRGSERKMALVALSGGRPASRASVEARDSEVEF